MSKHQLTRRHILRTSEEISEVLKQRPKSSLHFSFHEKTIQAPESLDLSRLGLAIPKKMAKRAVDRNRIKRLIREVFRQADLSPSKKLVLKLKSPVGRGVKGKLRNAEYQLIKKEVNQFFHD